MGVAAFGRSPRLQGSLDELRGIAIEQTWRKCSSSNGGSADHPTWVLSFDFGEWSVRFFASHREDKAYAKLEHLARRLQVHALDRTGEKETRHAWHELDRSVAESLQSKGENVDDPGSPPHHGGILWEPASGVGSIVLPAVGSSRATVVLILFGMLFAGSSPSSQMPTRTPAPVRFEGGPCTSFTLRLERCSH